MKHISRCLCLSLVLSSLAVAAHAELPKQLNAATSGNLPPVSFVNVNNQLDGFDIDVAKYVESQLGIPMEIHKLDFKGILPGLQTGRFDIVFSNVNITPERQSNFDYSIPYSRSAVVMVVRDGVKDVQTFADMKNKNVGGIAGGNDGEVPARSIEKEVGAFKSFKGYGGYTEMFSDMAAGRLDVIIAPDTAAANILKQRPNLAKIVGAPYQVRYVGAPMKKGSAELKQAVDKALLQAREQGLIDQWAEKHFGISKFTEQLPQIEK
jgi:cystine transport system substrate-binding protein